MPTQILILTGHTKGRKSRQNEKKRPLIQSEDERALFELNYPL